MDEADRKKNCLEKLTWASAEEASAGATYARWQHGKNGARPQPYRCKYCNKWHLARGEEHD